MAKRRCEQCGNPVLDNTGATRCDACRPRTMAQIARRESQHLWDAVWSQIEEESPFRHLHPKKKVIDVK